MEGHREGVEGHARSPRKITVAVAVSFGEWIVIPHHSRQTNKHRKR